MAFTRRQFIAGSVLAAVSSPARSQGVNEGARAMWEDVMDLLAANYYEPVDEIKLTLGVLNRLSKQFKFDLRSQAAPPADASAARALFAQEIARMAARPGSNMSVEEMTVHAIEALCDWGLKFSSFKSEQAIDAEQHTRTSAPADIGMTNYIEGERVICRPFDNGPAWALGVREGDELLSINGVSVRGLPLWRISRDRHGPDGSECRITVQQQREPRRIISGTIVRHVIVRTPVVTKVPGGMMVRIQSFGIDSAGSPKPELVRALKQLQPHDILTLDLRGNAGGLTENAADVLGCLLPGPAQRPSPILLGRRVLRGARAGEYTQEIVTDEPCQCAARRVIVLVDGGSASSTELVTQVLVECPDLHVTVGGERTFGKHLVQNDFTLPRRPTMRINFPYGHMMTAKGTTWEKGILPTFRT